MTLMEWNGTIRVKGQKLLAYYYAAYAWMGRFNDDQTMLSCTLKIPGKLSIFYRRILIYKWSYIALCTVQDKLNQSYITLFRSTQFTCYHFYPSHFSQCNPTAKKLEPFVNSHNFWNLSFFIYMWTFIWTKGVCISCLWSLRKII